MVPDARQLARLSEDTHRWQDPPLEDASAHASCCPLLTEVPKGLPNNGTWAVALPCTKHPSDPLAGPSVKSNLLTRTFRPCVIRPCQPAPRPYSYH